MRLVVLETFFPLIHEIIQLRDRLAFRKQCYKQSLPYPLKSSILYDICLRLQQKITIKVLFLKSQLSKEMNQLFTAYFDLLITKPIQKYTVAVLRKKIELKAEKNKYLDYAKQQLCELKKLQVFDCWKRLKAIEAFQETKVFHARRIIE